MFILFQLSCNCYTVLLRAWQSHYLSVGFKIRYQEREGGEERERASERDEEDWDKSADICFITDFQLGDVCEATPDSGLLVFMHNAILTVCTFFLSVSNKGGPHPYRRDDLIELLSSVHSVQYNIYVQIECVRVYACDS